LNIYSLKYIINGLKKLDAIINSSNELILHCHMFHACIVGITYKMLFKNIPIIFTLHTNSVKQLYRRLLLFSTKNIRDKDVIFSRNSNKWYLNNKLIIPNGVNFKNFNIDGIIRDYDKNSTFVILYLGRLSEEKNPLYLIELANKLKKSSITNFKINVVGEGKLEKKLKLLITKNNLTTNIKLLGYKKDIKSYLLNSHCLIIPSFVEGLPITLIEASATKLPIIATPVGSIPDFLNNENANLSNLKNFHLAVLSVIKNYSKSIIKSNKLFFEVKSKFDMEAIFMRHLEAYENLFERNIVAKKRIKL